MVTVKRGKRLVVDLLINVSKKIPFVKKKIASEIKMCCSVPHESYLDIPTFIRQGRELSHL